jgi:hypothetical protein
VPRPQRLETIGAARYSSRRMTRLQATQAELRQVLAEHQASLSEVSRLQAELSALRAATTAPKTEAATRAATEVKPTTAAELHEQQDPWAAFKPPGFRTAPRAGHIPPSPATELPPPRVTEPGSSGADLEEVQKARREGALRTATKEKAKSLAQDYIEFCEKHARSDPRRGWDKLLLAEFLWQRAVGLRRPNAASWRHWQSRIECAATVVWGLPSLPVADKEYLRQQRVACQKTVGVRVVRQTPVGRATLLAIHKAAGERIAADRKLRATMWQLTLMLHLVVRAGEVANTGRSASTLLARDTRAGERREINALPQARDVAFTPPDSEAGLPFGGIRLMLYDTKKVRLTGQGKHEGEPAFAAGTGGPLCPVAAMRALFEERGLHAEDKGTEFLFISPSHHEWKRGATAAPAPPPIKSKEFNANLATLCELAALPRFTMRATRYGACCDMEAAGVPGSIADAAGRWKAGSRQPYSSMTMQAAVAIAGLVGK